MSTFHTAIQDFVAAVRRGPAAQVSLTLGEVLRTGNDAGPEEASWALLALVELLAAPDCRHAGPIAVVCTQCMIQGASPWVATGLVIERLCQALDRAAAGGPVSQGRLGRLIPNRLELYWLSAAAQSKPTTP